MKVLSRQLNPDRSGTIRLQPETGEDIWHLYNIVAVDDQVSAVSWRKVQNVSNTGSTTTNKVKTTITLAVVTIDYDAPGETLRVSGKNVAESKFLKLGQFHTLEIVSQRNISITKSFWDDLYLERVQIASDPASTSDAAVVLLQPGLAHISLVGAHMTTLVSRIETTIPKKRVASTTRHDKGLLRFFDQVLTAISTKIRFDVVKCIVIGSPGFLKDDLMQYMMDESSKRDLKQILNNRHKFILVACSSAHMQSLQKVLTEPAVSALIEDTKALAEVKALEDFYHVLNFEPNRAFYGPKHVQRAFEENAIDTLLITDELFRSADPLQRKAYVSLVDSVKDNAGQVLVFSTQHSSGQQLAELTGIAAILRFPIHTDSESEDDIGSSEDGDASGSPEADSSIRIV